jgi:hypothetical protein
MGKAIHGKNGGIVMDLQPTDSKISMGKVAVAAGGTGASKMAELLNHLTLSDVAASLTIIFLAIQIYCFVKDRFAKRKKH